MRHGALFVFHALNNRIHRTALVDDEASIGHDVEIGPYAVIEGGAVIGDECSIAAHAVIKRHTRLGKRNRIAEHAVIGGEPQDYKFKPCVSLVQIGDDNLVREGVTIHRGSTEGAATRIGDRNFLMAMSHIGHDCALGNDIVIANASLLAGFVTVHDRAFISGAVAVHQFSRVGRLAMLGGGTKLTQDALPFVITNGSPGRARAVNVVGLKRAGVAAHEIANLRRAFHMLGRTHGREQLLLDLRALDSQGVGELADFIETSQRGTARTA
jgi:UDP-N-acetylglucosamine acyltransferase